MTKADQTRQFIIEKTASVFNAKGFAGTSLTDITDATGLTKGSIYGNFTNKDEVALAVFDYNFAQVTEYIRKKLLLRENSIDRLLVYPSVYRDFLKIPFLLTGCPILNTSTEADDTHPALKQKAADAIMFWKKSLESQIQRGIKSGEIKSSTSVTELAIIIITVIEGAVMQAKVTNRSTELRIAMDYLERIIENCRE